MCMMLAPALNAAWASRAICSGVTGTLCCFGSVSTPFSAQVMTALSLMACLQVWGRDHPGRVSPLLASTRYSHAPAGVDRQIARTGKDRARFQAVEPSDRMAEMRG